MSEGDRPEIGSIGWVDLTVQAAGEVRDFYETVVGRESSGPEGNGRARVFLRDPRSCRRGGRPVHAGAVSPASGPERYAGWS